MPEISLFVDESGESGTESKYYLLTLVFHEHVVLDRFGYWDFSYNLSCLDSRRKRRSSYGHQG